MTKPRIAIPIPTSFDPEYNDRTWPQYATAIERSGGEPVAVPLSDLKAAEQLAKSCSAVLLPGSGADVDPAKFGQSRNPNTADADRAREAVDALLLESAEQDGRPTLAICFGAQMLNVWRGGSLIQHLPEEPVKHRQRNVIDAHQAAVEAGSLLASSAGLHHPAASSHSIPVNSSHHQAIGSAGKGLRVVARTPEDGVVEAIEGTDARRFVLGVQWHPERTYGERRESKALFDRLVAEAAEWSARSAAK